MRTHLATLALLATALPAWAGSLDAPAAPAAGSGMPSTTDIYNRLDTGAAVSVPGTFQEPAAGPTAGTGRTLADIAAKLPVPDNTQGAAAGDVANGKTFWGLRTDGTWGPRTGTQAAPATGSNVTGANGQLTFTIPDGLYSGGKTATAADSNLQPGNIKSGVSIFGVTGTVVAVPPNTAPVANAGAPQSVMVGALVTLNGSASSDADGDPLTHQWSLIYKPNSSSAALNSTTTPSPIFTPDVDGAYVFALVVNDGKVDSSAAFTSVTSATPDTHPPITTAAPSVSGTTNTSTTLSVTIHENGTGYYLPRPTSAAAPTVAEVLAGTPFAMTAFTPATPTVGGLTFNTPYTIDFIAKDLAGNVQTTVQSVTFTTVPTNYAAQGGLAWMPISFSDTWANAAAYCTNTTINGVTGWRMPTDTELNALYASGAMNGKGWSLGITHASTLYFGGPNHWLVNLATGAAAGGVDSWNPLPRYVACVHN